MESYIKSSTIASFLTSTEVKLGAVVFVVSKAVLDYIRYLRSSLKKPPGPWGYPIIGHLHLLGKAPNVTFQNMRATYGDVFRIRLGSWPTVVINGKDAIRDALHNHKDTFSSRPPFFGFSLADGPGVLFGEFDDAVILHRKMVVNVLNSISSPKSKPVEELLHREVEILLACFTSKNGASFNPYNDVFLAAGSIIYQLCYGRLQNIREDKDFAELVFRSQQFVEFGGAGNIVNMFPVLQYVIPWKVEPLKQVFRTAIEQRSRKVEEHAKTFDRNYLRDLTDGLIRVAENDGNEARILGKRRIFNSLDDIIGAGFGTVANTLEWMLLLMASHPEIQERVQKEIDDVVGPSRVPSSEDRCRMRFTEATLNEILRFSALVPLSIPRFTTADTEFHGYSISKGTVVFINLYSMSHDPAVWGDPEVFRPDRFIDTSGQIRKELLEEFLPFSTGRRRCLGELLARTELFLFFAGILQRCTIVKPADVERYDFEAEVTLTRSPKPFVIQVVIRD